MSLPRRPIHPGDEERLADEMGRELEELGEVHGIRPTAGFADRVMAAITNEPTPQPAVALRLALRRRRLGAALAAVGDSWRVAFGGPRPFAVRAQALALVLVVAIGVLGTGGAAVVGASRLLGLEETPSPSVQPSPVVSPVPSIEATPSPSPSPTPSVSPSTSPTETPEATETTRPTETPEESDDNGGEDNSGSGSGDDNSGSGSGSEDDRTEEPDDHTPEPTDDD